MISQLDIYIDQVLNPNLLIVKDASYYNPDIEVTNAIIEFKIPGSNLYYTFETEPGFTEIINSNSIGLTSSIDNNLAALPDGIWTIKYSICPNEELYVEYTFLRNVQQLVKYYNKFCELDKCKETEEFNKLQEIYTYIKGAEYKANCSQYQHAIELYEYADKLLERFKSCDCAKN